MEQVAVFQLFKGLSLSSDNLLLFSFGGSFDIPIRFDFPFVSHKMANKKNYTSFGIKLGVCFFSKETLRG